MVLAQRLSGRDNNITFLRLIAATAVVFSHSFTLAKGPGTSEPPAPVLPTSFGTIAVAVFFTLSGLLIAQSYARHESLPPFLRARFLRIYPGLAVAVLFCALVVGPLFGSLPVADYFRQPATWSFISRNATLRSLTIQSTLPGAFPVNPLNSAVNDPLWTLPYEVCMYVLVAIAGVAGLFRRRWVFNIAAVIAMACAAAVIWEDPAWPQAGPFVRLGLFFLSGVAAYVNRASIPISARLLALGAAIAAAVYETPLFMTLFWVTLAYGVLVFAYAQGRPTGHFRIRWDLSYGIYIYGFPCQQICAAISPGIRPLPLFALAMLLTVPLAAASWVLVERPALRFKTPFRGGSTRPAAAVPA